MPHPADAAAGGAPSLAGIELLRGVPDAERRAVEAKCVLRRCAAGDVLIARYSAGSAVYFLLSGVARVVHYLPGEDEITIATVGAGETIGEIAAIDKLGRSATIIADEDCTVAELPHAAFEALVVTHGRIALALLRRWAAIIRELDDKYSYVTTISPDQRVFSQLVRLSRQERPGGARWVIRDLPGDQDLAEWSQTSRESVAGAIAELLRRGVAERHGKSLVIIDYATLKSLVIGGGRAERPDAPRQGG